MCIKCNPLFSLINMPLLVLGMGIGIFSFLCLSKNIFIILLSLGIYYIVFHGVLIHYIRKPCPKCISIMSIIMILAQMVFFTSLFINNSILFFMKGKYIMFDQQNTCSNMTLKIVKLIVGPAIALQIIILIGHLICSKDRILKKKKNNYEEMYYCMSDSDDNKN